MSGFKEPGFADRQKAAQRARQNLLNKFRAQPGPNDPEVAKRRAEREAVIANRERLKQEPRAAQGGAETPRGRGRSRRGRPHRSREGRGNGATGRARSRAEGQARRPLRGSKGPQQEEEMTAPREARELFTRSVISRRYALTRRVSSSSSRRLSSSNPSTWNPSTSYPWTSCPSSSS